MNKYFIGLRATRLIVAKETATTEHVVIVTLLFLLFLLLLLGSGCGRSGGSLGSSRGRSGEGGGVGNVGLDLLGSREGVLGSNSHGEHVLVGRAEGVGKGRESRVSNCEREGGHLVDTVDELRAEISISELEHGGFINSAIVVDLDEGESI